MRLGGRQRKESAHVGEVALVLLASAFVGGTGFCADQRVGAAFAFGDMGLIEAKLIDTLVDRSFLLVHAETMDLPHGIAREEFEFAEFGRMLAPNGKLLSPINRSGRRIFAPAQVKNRRALPERNRQFRRLASSSSQGRCECGKKDFFDMKQQRNFSRRMLA